MKMIFGFIVLLVLIAAFFLFPKPAENNVGSDNPINENKNSESVNSRGIVLSKSLISEHNKPDDCWLFIDDSVYSATNFLQNHSGGPDKITPYCGGDQPELLNLEFIQQEPKRF